MGNDPLDKDLYHALHLEVWVRRKISNPFILLFGF